MDIKTDASGNPLNGFMTASSAQAALDAADTETARAHASNSKVTNDSARQQRSEYGTVPPVPNGAL